MLPETLFDLQAHLYVVMLVIRLVQLVAFNAVEVLSHVKFFIVRNLPVKSGVVEYTAFLQYNPKNLVLILIRQILTVIAYAWIRLVVLLVNRVRSLVFVCSSLESWFLTSDNKINVRITQRFQGILLVFREFVFGLVFVKLELSFRLNLFEFNQGSQKQSIEMF